MKLTRLILLCSVLVCYCTITTAQTETSGQQGFSSSKIKKYRQLFWDSLPRPISWTNDYAWLFSTAQRNQLDSTISNFEKRTTVEISIVTLDTFCVSKEKFEDLALHIATTWRIGKKEKNNGILICICTGYRMIRIENGYGIENYLTDEETKEIIDTVFLPQYKKGDFFAGTNTGLNSIISKFIEKNIH